MPTGTAGTNAQKYHTNQVMYLAKSFTFAVGNGTTSTIGTLPTGAIVINAGIVVTTAFNAGTANTLDIGPSTDTDGWATALALGTVGRIPGDEFATSNDLGPFATDTVVNAVWTLSGTAATTGAGVVYVEYIVPDRAP